MRAGEFVITRVDGGSGGVQSPPKVCVRAAGLLPAEDGVDGRGGGEFPDACGGGAEGHDCGVDGPACASVDVAAALGLHLCGGLRSAAYC